MVAERSGGSRHRHGGLAVAVVLHGLLLWAWLLQTGTVRVTPPQRPAGPAISWVLPMPAARPTALAPKLVQAPPPQARSEVRSLARAVTPEVHTGHRPSEAPIATIPVEVEPSASAPEAPSQSLAGRLMHGSATRQALRQSAQQPLLAEAAAQVAKQPIHRSDEALQQGVTQAAHGDCLKGEGAGGGMGLLSLPFLAYAAAAGKCAR